MKLIYKPSVSMVKPAEIEFCKYTVYVRKNITSSMDTDGETEIWTYDEAALTRTEFEEYSKIMEAKKAINDENQMIIMEAIADLYDKISDIQGGLS